MSSDDQPVFFGPETQRLHGFLHAGATGAPGGVVIAQSLGHEYTRAHRSLVHLGQRLARAGLPTLRFDWSGVGDSAGEFHTFGLDRWISDLNLAVSELRRRTDVRRLIIVGQDWGGVIAAMAAAARGDIHSLVLWDPVTDGAAAFSRIHDVESLVARSTTAKFRDTALPPGTFEAVGTIWSSNQKMALERMRLTNIARRPAQRVLLVDTLGRDVFDDIRARFEGLGATVQMEQRVLPAEMREDPFKPRVPLPTIQAIVSWINT